MNKSNLRALLTPIVLALAIVFGNVFACDGE